MGPITGPSFVFLVFLCLKTSFAYVEAVAAHADPSFTKKFEPSVTFICSRPPMHRVPNGWVADFNRSASCLTEPEDVLEYCKKLYPDHAIKNVVETSYEVDIGDWPRFEGKGTMKTKAVRPVHPFRCIDDFESEALLVPQRCVFDHVHDNNQCERPTKWSETASTLCQGENRVLESWGMLVVCGTDRFRGVEFVCCPKDEEPLPTVVVPHESSEEEDDYLAYLKGDDDFLEKYDNEHAKFKAAQRSMEKHQQARVSKEHYMSVTGLDLDQDRRSIGPDLGSNCLQRSSTDVMMKQWQEAREHVSEMRKTDGKQADQVNKEITERFQRMYHAYEQEGSAEKKQLTSLHQQHVQAAFNKKKRELMENLATELEEDKPRTSKVLSYLKQYIRTEEKDRLHTVNHYEHMRDTDPEEAIRIRTSVQNHLKLITKRIEQAIEMLKRHPDMEKKIKPEIEDFRHKKFRNIEISSDEVVLKPIEQHEPEQKEIILTPVEVDSVDSYETEEHDYTNIRIDTDGLKAEDTNQPYVAHVQNDGAHLQQHNYNTAQAVSNYNTGNILGIAIGSVAVFIIIVVAVVMLRKRNRRQPITHGFVEVDPAASPEERHVANMQMNGYENPTYRYFEIK